jgi:hypothetical protein
MVVVVAIEPDVGAASIADVDNLRPLKRPNINPTLGLEILYRKD